MKVSRQQAAENRHRVVDVASALFREKGFDGVGVADIMHAAGLTHGGFYASFAGKTDLEVEAVDAAFGETFAALKALAQQSPDPLRAIVQFYLSPAHRDRPGSGCAVVALAPDAARSGLPLREAFERGIKAYLALLSELPGGSQTEALATLSTLVGALTLARTVADRSLSDQILAAAAKSITEGMAAVER